MIPALSKAVFVPEPNPLLQLALLKKNIFTVSPELEPTILGVFEELLGEVGLIEVKIGALGPESS